MEKSESTIRLERMLASNPPLVHEEFKILFITPTLPREEMYKHLLLLPRESAISDLCNIIRFAVENTEVYATGERKDLENMFAVHALFLLGEMHAVEALDDVLDFLKQDESILEFWIGSFLTESIPEVLADIYDGDLQKIETFLREPTGDSYARVAALDMLLLLFNEQKISRAELVGIFARLLDHFDSLFDDEKDVPVVTFITEYAADAKLTELEDRMKRAFGNYQIDPGITGDWNKLQEYLHSETHIERKRIPMHERYGVFDNSGFGDLPDFDNEDEFIHYPSAPFVRDEPKTGRNDPCPCGSGKKFKKCHGK